MIGAKTATPIVRFKSSSTLTTECIKVLYYNFLSRLNEEVGSFLQFYDVIGCKLTVTSTFSFFQEELLLL